MTDVNIIESKINIYNNIRNFCIYNMNNSNDINNKQAYMDIINLIDLKMKKDDIEHYVFTINLKE